ncbi:putative secreted protein [Ixodes scapularis]
MGLLKVVLFVSCSGFLALRTANAECINVTLPNVLDLGSCLGTTLVTCPDTSDGLLLDLQTITRCVLEILPQVGDPIQVLDSVLDLLEVVLERLGLSFDVRVLSEILCRPLGLPIFNCGNTNARNSTCGPPLQVTLPSGFNVGHCMNRTLLFCAEGTPVTDPVVRELVKALSCILSGAPEDIQLNLVQSLVCPLVDVVTSSLDEFTEFLPFRVLTRGIKTTVGTLTDSLLESVISCP